MAGGDSGKWWERITEWLAGQFGEAMTDIRRRAVEEPWFGKPLDGPPGGGKSGTSGPSVHMKVVNSETTLNKTTTSHEVHFSINNGGSAWDWQPDPRATSALQRPVTDIESKGQDRDIPGDKGRGVDF